MSDFSFGIKSTSDFFRKLLEDYNEFCKDKTSSRKALNCAMTAWHLTEWTYNEFFQQFSSQFSTLGLYQQDIKIKCPSLQILQDITYGTKHYKLTRHNPIIKETNIHEGAFSIGYSRDFDISTLDIELDNGTKIYFEDEILKTINFWTDYLQSNFNITI